MGKEKQEGANSHKKLRAKTSVAEILDIAIQFEKTAHKFYTSLIPKVSKNMRYLVEELAQEEQEHFELFSKLRANPEIEVQLAQMVKTPASHTKFSEAIHAKDLGEKPDDQTILQYAMSREHAAMEQYATLATEVEAGPIRDLFTFLGHEEAEHRRELEKLYYDIVHSGGV